MHTQLRRHDKVRLIAAPDPDYIEYYTDDQAPIPSGTHGTINVILPNGKYHIRIEKNGQEYAYVVMDEEALEKID